MAQPEKFLCAIRKSRYFSGVAKITHTGRMTFGSIWGDTVTSCIALFFYFLLSKDTSERMHCRG